MKQLILAGLILPSAGMTAQDILPFPPTPSGSSAGITMENSTYKKRIEPVRLPRGAPSILIILMDDVGPGTSATFGGEINTPTMDRVAKNGHYLQSISQYRHVLTNTGCITHRTETIRQSVMDRSLPLPTTLTVSAASFRNLQQLLQRY